jgi:hypothetical protein
MSTPEFYLRFIEGFHDEEPRSCWRVRQIGIGVPTDSLLVRVDPMCSGRNYGLDTAEIPLLILSPKYQGGLLFPINEWPLDVYIYLPMVASPELRVVLEQSEFKKIAFGEIYLKDKHRTQPSGIRKTNPW